MHLGICGIQSMVATLPVLRLQLEFLCGTLIMTTIQASLISFPSEGGQSQTSNNTKALLPYVEQVLIVIGGLDLNRADISQSIFGAN